MSYNRPSGQTVEELTERAVTALVREWGVSEAEARAAINRTRKQEERLGRELARERAWSDCPERPAVVDLTEPARVA